MSKHADPVRLDGDLRTMCDMARDGATTDECVAWLYHDADHGQGIEPGYIGWAAFFPATLRTKRKERHREVIALRKRGWRYEAIGMQVNMSDTNVGRICRDAGLGKEWYAREFPCGMRGGDDTLLRP